MDKMTYRDYLIWTASHAAHALNDAVAMALTMRHEGAAIQVLEHRLDNAKALVEFRNPNQETVLPRPPEPLDG